MKPELYFSFRKSGVFRRFLEQSEKVIDSEDILSYNRSKTNDKGGGDVFLG